MFSKMEYFHSKLAYLKAGRKKFYIRRDSVLLEIFENSFSGENFVATASFPDSV